MTESLGKKNKKVESLNLWLIWEASFKANTVWCLYYEDQIPQIHFIGMKMREKHLCDKKVTLVGKVFGFRRHKMKTKKEHKSDKEEAKYEGSLHRSPLQQGIDYRRGKKLSFFFIKRSSCSDNDICVRQRAVYIEIYCFFSMHTFQVWVREEDKRWGGYLIEKTSYGMCIACGGSWQWKPTTRYVRRSAHFFCEKFIEEAERIARVILQLPFFVPQYHLSSIVWCSVVHVYTILAW